MKHATKLIYSLLVPPLLSVRAQATPALEAPAAEQPRPKSRLPKSDAAGESAR
jgi:hypothetical protein